MHEDVGPEPAEREGGLAPDAARRASHERLSARTVDARNAGDLLGLPSVRHRLFDGLHVQNAAHRDSLRGDLELDQTALTWPLSRCVFVLLGRFVSSVRLGTVRIGFAHLLPSLPRKRRLATDLGIVECGPRPVSEPTELLVSTASCR